MEHDALTTQVHLGMQVVAADGKKIGKVRRIHTRETEAYLEVPHRGALWGLMAPKARFIPGSAVARVVDKRVHLNMDAKTAKGCTVRPRWIDEEIDRVLPGLGAS